MSCSKEFKVAGKSHGFKSFNGDGTMETGITIKECCSHVGRGE
jgi:hypothetical protein